MTPSDRTFALMILAGALFLSIALWLAAMFIPPTLQSRNHLRSAETPLPLLVPSLVALPALLLR